MKYVHKTISSYVANSSVLLRNYKEISFIQKVKVFPLRIFRFTRRKIFGIKNPLLNQIFLNAQNVYTDVSGQKINYISFRQALVDTQAWIPTFGKQFDLIVGVPRSGLLFANIIANQLARPLSVPQQGIDEVWLSKHIDRPRDIKDILLIDDSVRTGDSMKEALKQVKKNFPNAVITSAAIYTGSESKDFVDTYCKLVERPRVFEWNILHGKKGRVAFDFDGFLCEEVQPSHTSSPDKYLEFIKNAKPYLIPSYEIDAIITNRLEDFRIETELWLRKHEVRYAELFMRPGTESDSKHRFKINTVRKVKPSIFFESSKGEAEVINKSTGVPVYCAEIHSFVSNDNKERV